jgi:MFS transporter, PPP family, 3-phenylpropionic acid transporter
MAFTTELWALVLLQALHSCTFAATHLGAMAFLQRALPANGVAIGQSLYYALGTGAMQALIYQFSGLLYAEVGQLAFLGMTVVCAIGMCCLLPLARLWKGELLVGATAARSA